MAVRNEPEWQAFRGMINRCENPRVRSYPRYGGRGIKVCEMWRNNYAAFLAHVGRRPSPRHSIDRIDPNRNYEPGNVRWATSLEQQNNRRNTRRVVVGGREIPLCDAVRAFGSVVHHEAVWVRIKTGWDPVVALTTPRLHVSGNARKAA